MPEHLATEKGVLVSSLTQTLGSVNNMLLLCQSLCSSLVPRAPDTLLLDRFSLAGHDPNTEPRQALETQGGPLDDHWPSAELLQAHLAGSFDVEMVEPLQNGNPGHHPNGRVTKVAVQDLHNPVQVQGDWSPVSAVGETKMKP